MVDEGWWMVDGGAVSVEQKPSAIVIQPDATSPTPKSGKAPQPRRHGRLQNAFPALKGRHTPVAAVCNRQAHPKSRSSPQPQIPHPATSSARIFRPVRSPHCPSAPSRTRCHPRTEFQTPDRVASVSNQCPNFSPDFPPAARYTHKVRTRLDASATISRHLPSLHPLLHPQVIERLYDLNVGTLAVVPGAPAHERPHKPLLLLAALDLLDEGLATPDHIPWCQELRDRFTARFLLVRKHNDQDNPELPFRYLASDGFWKSTEADGTTLLRRTPLIADLGKISARFTDSFEMVASIPTNRRLMRDALIARFFPAPFQTENQPSSIANRQSTSLVAEEPLEYGRSRAFRLKIVEIYDHQCAA